MELLTLLRTIAPEFEELEDTVLQTWLDLTQPLEQERLWRGIRAGSSLPCGPPDEDGRIGCGGSIWKYC